MQITKNNFFGTKTIIISGLSIFLFTGCFGEAEPEQWTSLIYPDKENTKRSKKHGIYPSLEECKKASKIELSNLDLETKGTYQCGLNCNYHEGMKVDICEKTSK